MNKKPNILWICTDQQRFDTIHELGNQYINTPATDNLIKGGCAFLNTYAQSPVCTPSRASFLTGRYPKTTRVNRNGNEYFPPDEVMVTKIFADHGYDCGLVGKLHLSAAEGMVEVRPDDGYHFFEWSEHPHDDWETGHAYQDWLKEKGIRWNDYYILGDGKSQGTKDNAWKKCLPSDCGGMISEYHQTTWAFERAEYFINQNHDGRPWLISINIFDPHPPYDPPKEYRDQIDASKLPLPLWQEGELLNKPDYYREDYEQGSQGGSGPCAIDFDDAAKRQLIADYYAQIEHTDKKMSDFFDRLHESGHLENTIILFHSDHGEMCGDHGLYWKGAYSYEQLIHVPMIFKWEGHIMENLKSTALVELVDIAPTLLELADIEVPFYMQGKSLKKILTGEAAADFHKEAIHSEYYRALPPVHNKYISIYFDGRYKIAVHHNEEISELYDLRSDPNEFENLWNLPEYCHIQLEYLKKCFDLTTMNTMDPKPRTIRKF
jgi:arylsulfatase A-like enzyme